MVLFKCFFYAHWQLLKLLLAAPRALLDHGWGCVPKRAVIFVVFFPLFWLLCILHFIGFALDALLFPGWRRQRVERPVFIVGVPRSGTTFLHRFLAQDARFSFTPMWEALLAPSIVEKIIWRGLLKLLSPLLRISHRLAPAFFSQMDGVHKLGLNEAEEDFLFLLPLNASFILVALFPNNQQLWRLTRFDWDMPAWEQRLIGQFYYACVAKHLYFKTRWCGLVAPIYLAKNPSFATWVETLAKQFGDAGFVICLREPEVVLPSQIRSLLPAFALLGSGRCPDYFNERCTVMLADYYRHLMAFKRRVANTPIVMNETLRHHLPSVLQTIYQSIHVTEDAALIAKATVYLSGVEPSKAPRDYRLEELNLSAQSIQLAFKDVWPVNV
ncbi:MAG TPA: sulfotransferase [Marinagarivorans sp.]